MVVHAIEKFLQLEEKVLYTHNSGFEIPDKSIVGSHYLYFTNLGRVLAYDSGGMFGSEQVVEYDAILPYRKIDGSGACHHPSFVEICRFQKEFLVKTWGRISCAGGGSNMPGTESMVIVGLPDASVKESKERVISAISHFDVDVTDQKVVVNLSHSEQKKNGPLFDLAIAIAALKELGFIKRDIPKGTAFIGALSLDGAVEKAQGMLPALVSAKAISLKKVYFPHDSYIPFHMLEDLECIVVQHIEEVVNHLDGQGFLSFSSSYEPPNPILPMPEPHQKDFCHVIGHGYPKQALEIAAAGEHNVLMSGPPGCGKSLLAETFPSILPSLTNKAQLEVISLYQLAGEKRLIIKVCLSDIPIIPPPPLRLSGAVHPQGLGRFRLPIKEFYF